MLGVAFAPSEIPNTTIVQLLTALGKSQIITYTVPDTPMAASKTVSTVYSSGDTYMPEAPTDEELRTIGSSWPAIVAEMKQDYMSEHDIPNALVRGYGLTVSPFGGITAIAVSFHPKDSLEYITASNEKSTIVFGTPHGSSGCWKSYGLGQGTLPNPITATTEALLIESVALGSVFTSRVHNAIAATDDEPELRDIVFEEGQDVKEYLAKHTLMSPPLNALQYSAALNLVENPEKASSRLLVENPHIVGASIVAALTAPRSLCGDEDSKRILYSFACVGIMGLYTSSTVLALAKEAFEWLDANTPTETSFELEQRIIAMRTRTGNSGDESENLNVDNGFVSSMEKCGVCKEGMVWRDLRIAECTNKHRLSRCALTFLPITAPKDTRECSVCARTVLGGYVGEVRPPEGSLVEAVFGGWEACLQCGGRYWAERG